MPIQQYLSSVCLHQIKEGIIIVDQQGNVEACNSAIEKMLGYTEAEIVQKPIYQTILPEEYHEICQHWISHHLERFTTEKTPQTFRFTAKHSNQQQFPAICSIVNLQSEGHNGFLITIQDISVQQSLEAHQDELETRLRRESLMRHLAEVINESLDLHEILNTTAKEVGHFFQAERVLIYRTFFDPNTNIFKDLVCTQHCANEEVEPVTEEEINFEKVYYQGWSRKDFKTYINKEFNKKLTNMSFEQRVNMSNSLRGRMQNEELEVLCTHFKGLCEKYNIYSTLDAAVEYKGLPYGKVLLADSNADRHWTEDEQALVQFVADQLGGALAQSDLYASEQKARQEAEIANRRKSEFLGMMSHELRTPLNAIIGFSDMALKGMAGPLNEKQTSYLENVASSGNHLLDIVNDLLDVAQIETGHLAIHPFQFAIIPQLENVRLMMQEIADKRHIKLFFDIESDLGTLNADPARFRQILINLLGNAIKFNRDHGNVFLRLYKSQDQQWLIGEVKDTGIGIPQEKQKELFNKFYQVDSRIARMHQGTGLGLALTKELVELHGGEIQVNSIEGVGSTFIFKIPIQP